MLPVLHFVLVPSLNYKGRGFRNWITFNERFFRDKTFRKTFPFWVGSPLEIHFNMFHVFTEPSLFQNSGVLTLEKIATSPPSIVPKSASTPSPDDVIFGKISQVIGLGKILISPLIYKNFLRWDISLKLL